jgi:hypothetical protein
MFTNSQINKNVREKSRMSDDYLSSSQSMGENNSTVAAAQQALGEHHYQPKMSGDLLFQLGRGQMSSQTAQTLIGSSTNTFSNLKQSQINKIYTGNVPTSNFRNINSLKQMTQDALKKQKRKQQE